MKCFSVDVIDVDSHPHNQTIDSWCPAISVVCFCLLLRLCYLWLGCPWTVSHQGLLHWVLNPSAVDPLCITVSHYIRPIYI